jgi:hypothetical protein
MNRLHQRKLTRQEPDSNPNARLLCHPRTGSLLTYRAICAQVRERDIRERDIRERDIGERDIRERDIRERDVGERDIRERDIQEMDIWETDFTRGYAEVLLLQIDIHDVSGCLSISQSWRHWARFCGVTSPKNSNPLRV